MGIAGSFLSFILSNIFSEYCLSCGVRIGRFCDTSGERIDHEFHAFFSAGHTFAPSGSLDIPARLLCPPCWLRLPPLREKDYPVLEGVPVIAPFRTSSFLLSMVRYLKYSGGRSAAAPLSWWMAEALCRYLESEGKGRAGTALVPVPLHRSRRRRRGYNQAELLAEGVGRRTGIQLKKEAIFRIRDTGSQAALPPEERKSNVAGAFRANRPRERYRLILTDDLVTTGETAGECLRTLTEAGYRVEAVLAVGRSLD
jgi:ComF family protein